MGAGGAAQGWDWPSHLLPISGQGIPLGRADPGQGLRTSQHGFALVGNSGLRPGGEALSDLSSAPQNRNLVGQREHLRAHSLDVRLVVQALRVVGHAVAQLEQTVRKALKDSIALARCSHGLHQVRCGEEGTPVSIAETLPLKPRAPPAPSSRVH